MTKIDYFNIHEKFHIEQRLSLTEIAKKLKINRNTISRNFRDRGLEIIRHTQIDYSKINIKAFDAWSPEMAYWLGFFAADGSVSNTSNYIHVTLKLSDKNHLKKLQSFLNLPDECLRDAPCKYNGETVIQSKLSFTHKIIKERLIELGIVPSKSFKDINFLNFVPKDYWLHFILGFFDGDGSYHTGNISFNFAGSKIFLECIGNYFSSYLGFNPTKQYQANPNELYEICWHSMRDVKLFAKLHSTSLSDLPLERKLSYSKKIIDGKIFPKCSSCNSDITIHSSSGLCSKCLRETKRKVDRPTSEKLKELLLVSNYSAIGRDYGVSGNAVKKWAKSYNII